MIKIVNRDSGKIECFDYNKIVKFLYNTKIGRIILKLLTTKVFSKIGGLFMNTRLSTLMKGFITNNPSFDINKFEDIKYNSYNKYFSRKYKDKYLNIDKNNNHFISPCEGKIMILKINENDYFNIKQSKYKIDNIINNNIINSYKNGYLIILRLDVDNYHRYCFIDNGTRSNYQYISGKLHTVQPIVYDKYPIFHQNAREWCILYTENFDDVIEVEVGALLVGKIKNYSSMDSFKKGEEKGYFEFGGSTILLFVKDNVVSFDEDILINSQNGYETTIKYGEKIGEKK